MESKTNERDTCSSCASLKYIYIYSYIDTVYIFFTLWGALIFILPLLHRHFSPQSCLKSSIVCFLTG